MHSFFRHYGDAAEALAAVGELDAAATMVRRWRLRATALDRAAAGPGGDRCVGLIAVARRPRSGAAAARARGRAWPAPAEPFERGRSLLGLGAAQRQARRKRLAATTWARRSSCSSGYRPRCGRSAPVVSSLGSAGAGRMVLTETERRIVALVAAGRSNTEVARQLALSTKTVEWNLSKAYRKLGVRSRSELAARPAGQIEGFPRLVTPRR